jgi:hypothetical protein
MGITSIKEAVMDAELLKKEPPQPLRKQRKRPEEFPIDSLPSLLKDAVLGLHEVIQAPIPICAQSVLAIANLAVQGHADIMLPIGQVRPISCFFLTIAESGERKSSCDNRVLKVIEDHEIKLKKKYDLDREDSQNELAAWEKQRQYILGNNQKHPDKNSKKLALDALGKKPEMPLTPLLICPDPTFEGLCKLMQTGQPSLGLFSSEGGQFISGYGMNEENKIRTAAALSDVWDGKTIKRVRAKDGTTILKGRRLCMHLMVQPQIASGFLSDRALKDQGILSRILISSPLSSLGIRFQHVEKPENKKVLDAFKVVIETILAMPLPTLDFPNELAPRVITLNEDTASLCNEFSDHVERGIAEGKKLHPIRGLANKLPEHALRIGTTFALIENIHTQDLEYRYLKMGIDVASYYGDEALRLSDEGRFDHDLQLAERLLDWLYESWKEENISLPDIYQRSLNAIGDKKTASKIVSILEDHGWLQRNGEGIQVGGYVRRDSWRIIRE